MNDVGYDAPRPEAVRELGQALAAQQAASPAQTEALAQSFLARMQRDIDEQVDQRIRQQLGGRSLPKGSATEMREVAIVSLIIGAIVTIAKASDLGAGGIAIVWAAILLINVAWAGITLTRH